MPRPAESDRRRPSHIVVLLVALTLGLGLAEGAAAQDAPATQDAPAAPRAAGAGQPAEPAPAADLAPPADLAAPAIGADGPSVPAIQAAAARSGHDAAATLPHDLSPWGMFMAADLVVKAVMIGLAFASLITWTAALAKGGELGFAGRRLKQARAMLARAPTLADAVAGVGERRGPAPALVRAATLEVEMSAGLPGEGVKERVASRLERIEAATARALRRGTGALATIGATAPFVGLFGTVWGIMNSFIGISEAQTTNLAVVAPGIAEALLATAMGLIAAIPAVVLYNHFARRIADHRLALADCSAEILRLVSRDLDRRGDRRLAAAAE